MRSSGALSLFYDQLIQAAHDSDFPIANTIDLDTAYSGNPAPIQAHIDRYDQWIKSGHAGKMTYLERGRDRRADPKLVFPGAESMLCVAIPYEKHAGGASQSHTGPRYARYLHGDDYHDKIADRLETMMQKFARDHSYDDLKWKVCVDTSAILERSWASLAGIGWIGKNTLLIHPKHGSYLFLAEVLLNKKTGKGPSPLPDYCGNCTRCLSACPTQALDSHFLNSKRCISYLTLESRGKLDVEDDIKSKMGSWVAGCDICQEVCPFNIKPVKQALAEASTPKELGALQAAEWISLLNETESEYKARTKMSSLSRVKPRDFSRNLAIALRNASVEVRNDTTLRDEIKVLVKERLERETDLDTREEWNKTLESFQTDASALNP